MVHVNPGLLSLDIDSCKSNAVDLCTEFIKKTMHLYSWYIDLCAVCGEDYVRLTSSLKWSLLLHDLLIQQLQIGYITCAQKHNHTVAEEIF